MARDLVGCTLRVDGGTASEVIATLVEVEAYLGEADPASHAHRGPTPRAAIMFGPPGRLYVYLSYGMHHCANLVTEAEGGAGAVLLRAAQVEVGEEVVRHRRSRPVDGGLARPVPPVGGSRLLSGPGNLCRGLGVALVDNGLDVCAPGARLQVWSRPARPPIEVLSRIGISRASDRLLRFVWRGHPAVSAAGENRRAGTWPAPM